MINWDKTLEIFGYNKASTVNKSKVVTVCDQCGAERISKLKSHNNTLRLSGSYRCRKCSMASVYADPVYISKISNKMKQAWNNKEYRDNITTINRDNSNIMSERSKKMWVDPNFKSEQSKRSKSLWDDQEFKTKSIEANRIKCNTPEWRLKNREASIRNSERISISVKKKWTDPEFRERMLKVYKSDEFRQKQSDSHKTPEYIAKYAGLQPRTVSSLQLILYSILDDLKIKYYRERMEPNGVTDSECVVGPWSFDCVIPRERQKTLLIEINGEWAYSQPKQMLKDQQKASYIANNFHDKYELKYIWEQDLLNPQKTIETIKYWMGITKIDIIDFNFKDIAIKKCPSSDYKILLGKYHYLANAGRNGIAYGAYLEGILIAVCIFSPLVRQNLDKSLDCEVNNAKELSRLCIHPKYQKKNLASWFISKCIKKLPNKYSTIVSYADTTFNHNGAIYKACRFVQDKVVRPDYWYTKHDGWVINKKKLYNHAQKLCMTEKEYADKNNYVKVYGYEKLRFIFNR